MAPSSFGCSLRTTFIFIFCGWMLLVAVQLFQVHHPEENRGNLHATLAESNAQVLEFVRKGGRHEITDDKIRLKTQKNGGHHDINTQVDKHGVRSHKQPHPQHNEHPRDLHMDKHGEHLNGRAEHLNGTADNNNNNNNNNTNNHNNSNSNNNNNINNSSNNNNDNNKNVTIDNNNNTNNNTITKGETDAKRDVVVGKQDNVEHAGVPMLATAAQPERQQFVKAMMKHAWNGYKNNAWGQNEVNALTGAGHANGLFVTSGATIVDALDTLFLMNMTDELADAREWVSTSLEFNRDKGGSVFENTIRYLGGLLSAYALTKDKVYMEKAQDLGNRLLPAFDTPHGIPMSNINLLTGKTDKMGWLPCYCAVLAEMGTLNLEFEYLSKITGDSKYEKVVTRAMDQVLKQISTQHRHMFPNFVEIATGNLNSDNYRLGAYGDSFYEYLIKTWRFHGNNKHWNTEREVYDTVMSAVYENLVQTSDTGHMYIGDMEHGSLQKRMDHLACFLGGNLMLASVGANSTTAAQKFRHVAEGLAETCHHSYNRSATGLGPDIMDWSNGADGRGKGGNSFYWLRPETVETYFYMWRLTKEQKYRDWAWEAVQAIERNCRCPHGYCGVNNVDANPANGNNHHPTQESFFLAETLKYLYLIFDGDDIVNLDQWVFNTEAHPLPVQKHA